MKNMNKQSKQKFSDTELISADWEKGLQVLNVSSGERRQLRGPAIFVRALSSSLYKYVFKNEIRHIGTKTLG